MVHHIRRFVFNCPSRRWSSWPSLNMTANCYRPSNTSPAGGLTLFFFHCNGAHKEQWEPVIRPLFSQSSSSHVKIREAWAFDWPTHGDAGVLNQDLLKTRTESVPVYDWVPGVVQFLLSRYMQGHRVVLCGHSAGATTAVLTAAEFYPSLVSSGIIGLILVESAVMSPKVWQEQFQPSLSRMIALSASRVDTWKSRQDALLYLQNKRPWSNWDSNVIRSYVEHGLYEHPDGTVTLKCDKKREVEAFEDMSPHTEGISYLKKLCHAMPVHTIWGEVKNLIPDSARATLSDPSLLASVTTVAQAGHMVVQEQPIGLARAIGDILETMPFDSAETARLSVVQNDRPLFSSSL